MAYKAYITEALVCGSEDRLTSDRSLHLFAREAGMLRANVKSVREERSKQRYALQDFSYARITLVRGKSGWRVAGAEAIENFYLRAETREARAFVIRVCSLLRRVVRGESPHTRIFDDVTYALGASWGNDIDSREPILTLRILNELGYISPHPAYNHFLAPEKFQNIELVLAGEARTQTKQAIEKALVESQL